MKKIVHSLIIFVFVVSTSCINDDSCSYNLIDSGDGILVEQFDSCNTQDDRFTSNNTVYKSGVKYYFEYYHISPKDDTLVFNISYGGEDWKFTPRNEADRNTAFYIEMEIKPKLGTIKNVLPDYNQTVISYSILNAQDRVLKRSETGLVDNENNIWMHPPRNEYFKILELNPFPYIQKPFQIGNSWSWELSVGSHWGNPHWLVWDGVVLFKHHYEIVDYNAYQTDLGSLSCYRIIAIGNSELGSTELSALFSPKYGFVKLEYSNIDRSKTILNLVNVKMCD